MAPDFIDRQWLLPCREKKEHFDLLHGMELPRYEVAHLTRQVRGGHPGLRLTVQSGHGWPSLQFA
jgi:hypothetical protein